MGRYLIFAMAALLVGIPGQLLAGGPAWLCLPLEGVNQKNADACAQLLTTKLAGKHSPHVREESLRIVWQGKQAYVTFAMGDDVALSEVEAALRNSPFSVARDKLHLFGHVALEVEATAAELETLATQLKAVPNVAVEETSRQGDRALIVLDLPYPAGDNSRNRGSVSWESFQRNDFSSSADRSSIAADQLPSLTAISEALAQAPASLEDIRWSERHACRSLGAVAAPEKTTTVSSSR